MKKVTKSLVAATMAAFFSNAFGGQQIGTVTALHVRASDGLIYVYLSGTGVGRPACATISYWMIKDETSSSGKQQFAQLMLAYATGKTVGITGMGTCTRWSDGEDISEINSN